MPIGANSIDTINLLQRGGKYFVPADSGIGQVDRPTAVGQSGGRISTLETLYNFWIDFVPNPDEAKQNNPNLEYQLRTHPDVAADFAKRTFSVSAMPWRVDRNPKAGDRDTGDTVAKYVHDVLSDLPNWEKLIGILQYAVMVGGQGIEWTWHQNADGSEVPVQWHPVHMDRFVFDRLGNMALLTRDEPIWGVYVASDPQSEYKRILPHGKFTYHIHRLGQGTWNRPELEGYIYFGAGEDLAIFSVLNFDIFCLKFRMKFLERFGIPPTVLYYPENRAMTREIVRIADSLRGESIVTIPKLIGTGISDNVNSLYKVEQMPVPTGSYDFFEAFSEKYTRPAISRILLGSAEEGQKSEGKGGYSDHVSRKESGPNIFFRRDAANISETFNKQIIPPIVHGRFPNMPREYWPIFTLEAVEEKDRMQAAQIFDIAMKSVPVSEEDYYDQVGIRRPNPGERTLGGPQQQQSGMPSINAPNSSASGNASGMTPQNPHGEGPAQSYRDTPSIPTRGANGKEGPSAFPNVTPREAIGGGGGFASGASTHAQGRGIN